MFYANLKSVFTHYLLNKRNEQPKKLSTIRKPLQLFYFYDDCMQAATSFRFYVLEIPTNVVSLTSCFFPNKKAHLVSLLFAISSLSVDHSPLDKILMNNIYICTFLDETISFNNRFKFRSINERIYLLHTDNVENGFSCLMIVRLELGFIAFLKWMIRANFGQMQTPGSVLYRAATP